MRSETISETMQPSDSQRPKIVVNGVEREFSSRPSVAQLLEQLELPAKGVAVEVNLEVIPRQRHSDYLLSDGDRLEIVSLVGGG
jgi:sulfur carrier protein